MTAQKTLFWLHKISELVNELSGISVFTINAFKETLQYWPRNSEKVKFSVMLALYNMHSMQTTCVVKSGRVLKLSLTLKTWVWTSYLCNLTEI